MYVLPRAAASDKISYPLAIASDQHKLHKQQAQRYTSRKPISASVSKGEISQSPSRPEQGSQAAANSIVTARSQPRSGRFGVQRYTFDSNPTLNQNAQDMDKEAH